MNIVVHKQVEKFITELHPATKNIVVELIERLRNGIVLSMPVSRTMHSIHKKLAELRFKDRQGTYRVFYVIEVGRYIYLIHACKKKSEKTEKRDIEIILRRIKEMNYEKL